MSNAISAYEAFDPRQPGWLAASLSASGDAPEKDKPKPKDDSGESSKTQGDIDKALEDSFPASDPVTQA
jgi:hypothetical protein